MGRTVPNQKIVKVSKEPCNKSNLYATINLEAMEGAAQSLDAGAFKLWCYFAKNQNNYEFALSSKDVLDTFGMKIKQYNNAVDELIEKGYLVKQNGNSFVFNEVCVMPLEDNEKKSVMPKKDNAVMPKDNNAVMPFKDNQLCQKDIRNNTNNISNNTDDNTEVDIPLKDIKGIVKEQWLCANKIEYEVVKKGLARIVKSGAYYHII